VSGLEVVISFYVGERREFKYVEGKDGKKARLAGGFVRFF